VYICLFFVDCADVLMRYCVDNYGFVDCLIPMNVLVFAVSLSLHVFCDPVFSALLTSRYRKTRMTLNPNSIIVVSRLIGRNIGNIRFNANQYSPLLESV